jgi:hypothetical protein
MISSTLCRLPLAEHEPSRTIMLAYHRKVSLSGPARLFLEWVKTHPLGVHSAHEYPDLARQLCPDRAGIAGRLPIAHVFGQPVLEVPQDLFIPPDALQVILESFEGPLDLLLYLIRKQNLDVLNIPMADITRQYMGYVDAMRSERLELAAEYLLMAALLIEIKSRLLLPRPPLDEEGEGRTTRVPNWCALLDYEQMKLAALELDKLPQATAILPGWRY